MSLYLDDVLVFSETMDDHLTHLCLVAGLKLKPSKCHFVRQEVSYLGDIITPNGLLPNQKHIEALKEFTTPTSIKEIRQFLLLLQTLCTAVRQDSSSTPSIYKEEYAV